MIAFDANASVRSLHYPLSPPGGVSTGVRARASGYCIGLCNQVPLKGLDALEHSGPRCDTVLSNHPPLKLNLHILAVVDNPDRAGSHLLESREQRPSPRVLE